MLRLPKFINKELSVRLSLIVVSAMGILLMATLAVMLFYSRKAIKEEALSKASQTLEGTVQHIDNILLSVEQSSGNIYFSMLSCLDRPEMMEKYCREMVQSNPYVNACAIAFNPFFFKNREFFMAYAKKDKGVTSGSSSSWRDYAGQEWFTKPQRQMMPVWQPPYRPEAAAGDSVIFPPGSESSLNFCLPIPGADGKPIGVMAANVQLKLLSTIVLDSKPSPNSYCTLLAGDGSYIVHPDNKKLSHHTVKYLAENGADATAIEAAKAMVSGQTGYKPFSMDGSDYYVFYKPFSRSSVRGRAIGKLGWSAGIIYPKDDIVGDYNRLLYYVLAIAIVGLLLLFVLSRTIMHRQLKPLTVLTESAHRIAKGNYNDPIPDSHQHDELGRLQDNFQLMQQSLATNIGQLEKLKTAMQKRSEELRAAYSQAQKADRLKTAFLHNMTNQMIGPANAIDDAVNTIRDNDADARGKDNAKLADDISKNGETITELLNNLLKMSEE